MFRLNNIKELGFIKYGECDIQNNTLAFKLTKESSISNFLYAFVVKTEVRYIGKSTQSIYKRLNGSKNPGTTQRTNIRVKGLLSNTIGDGKKVDIYVFVQKEKAFYRGFEINIAAGLEDTIIRIFQPSWNISGK